MKERKNLKYYMLLYVTMNEGFTIQDGDDYGGAIPSIKELALLHLRKISGLCCHEFTAGYWEEKPLKVGGGIAIMRTYHEDTRAAFCNAVDFLLWLVCPMADKDFKEKYSEWKGEGKEWGEKIEERKQVFRKINEMFASMKFFDSMTGKTE